MKACIRLYRTVRGPPLQDARKGKIRAVFSAGHNAFPLLLYASGRLIMSLPFTSFLNICNSFYSADDIFGLILEFLKEANGGKSLFFAGVHSIDNAI